MKLISRRRAHQLGNALMTTLVITGVIASVFGAYLSLVSNRTRMTFRAQSWEKCIALCEAGLEEALVHLNKNKLDSLLSNGWVATNSVAGTARTLGEGFFAVTITTNAGKITIDSYGYEPLPHSPTVNISRHVRVGVEPLPLFPYAIAARSKADLSGNVDSFDSADPTYSTGGEYDAAKAHDQAFVGANETGKNNVLQLKAEARIRGRVGVGGGSTASAHADSSIGDSTWVDSSGSGIQSGHLEEDMNLYFPPVTDPFIGGYLTPGTGSVGGTNYAFVLTSGDYLLTSLRLKSDDVMVVTGDARLKVTGDFEIAPDGALWIQPSARLQVYVGNEISIRGPVYNSTAKAAFLSVYGLAGNDKLSIDQDGGEPPLVGTFYVPGANVDFKDGVVIGGIVGESIDIAKDTELHYDEALGRTDGPWFRIVSWEEL